MTRKQRTRQERLKAIQAESVQLGQEVVKDFLEAQVELIRRAKECMEARGVVPDGIRELARTNLPNLESLFETSGQTAFKTLGMQIPTVQIPVSKLPDDLEIPDEDEGITRIGRRQQ